MPDIFNHQSVILTNVKNCIGTATATLFAKAGFDVIINHKDFFDAKSAAEKCRSFGVKVLLNSADLSNYSMAVSFINCIYEEFDRKRIYALINFADKTKDAITMTTTPDDFGEAVHTSLDSVFNMCKLITPIFIENGDGRIINVLPTYTVEDATKTKACTSAGLIGLTKSLALELASHSITVNAVAPGFITEDMDSLSIETKSKACDCISLGRLGEPEEIAKPLLFLCSKSAGYITGQTIHIDGGLI